MSERQIVAMGGLPDDILLDCALALARGKRVLYDPTAGNEDPSYTVWWVRRLGQRATMTQLHFIGTDLREVVTTRESATGLQRASGRERPLEARLLG